MPWKIISPREKSNTLQNRRFSKSTHKNGTAKTAIITSNFKIHQNDRKNLGFSRKKAVKDFLRLWEAFSRHFPPNFPRHESFPSPAIFVTKLWAKLFLYNSLIGVESDIKIRQRRDTFIYTCILQCESIANFPSIMFIYKKIFHYSRFSCSNMVVVYKIFESGKVENSCCEIRIEKRLRLFRQI